ncbi:MAG: preprotein translocase subunit SecA [Thomasclavelia sp.]|jgi:preprotein translocase subunit SecA|nr:preprotein translocase subunit SecA [Thomasclavelia sp.]
MASKKEKIRQDLKKKQAKEGLNPEAAINIVDLQDQSGEDIVVEDFDGEYKGKVIPFNTKPQKEKKGLTARVRGIFDDERRELRQLSKMADEILELEPTYEKMSDEELKAQTEKFRKELEDGKTLDDILVDAFAVVREASWRCLGLKAFKVQVMGGITLHKGDIAEMKTGEGKTLTSIFPVYLNALDGKGVHVVTVNDYLAGRDAEDNGKVFDFLGLTVGLNKRELSPEQKRAAHGCDITYTTNSELGFDYLRDNMVTSLEDKVLCKGLNYALVDEVDSILIDESRTPLIISGGKKNTAALYIQADKFVKTLKEEKDYEVDLESKTVALTSAGIAKAEKGFKISNLYDIKHTSLVHHINQALKANYAMTRDVEYMIATEDGSRDINNAQIMIIDSFTGRVMPGRAYSDGLHQAIEAKEGVPIKEETVTRATITYQNFFRLFNKLAGMTGTAKTEEEEFLLIYNMRVIEIPTNEPVIRDDRPDKIYAKKTDKFKALCDEVEKRNSYGQPILIGTVAVETSELLSRMLTRRHIKHNVLNAKNHAKEAEIIARAGQKGAVTIATNMAGRGTDIKLGEGVPKIGGLAVIGSERHESRRIDNQLRGRSGRQGDPGYSVFYVSFEDDLMQRFGGDKMDSFTKYLDEDTAIESKVVSRAIESAQKRVEGQNFDSRKNILQYDDVMRQQREIMYKERDDIMAQDNLDDIVKGMFEQAIELSIKRATDQESRHQDIDVAAVCDYIAKNYMLLCTIEPKHTEVMEHNPEKLRDTLTEVVMNQYEARFNKDLEPAAKLSYERSILLGVIDYTWINHIDAMTKLRNGIYLRAYAQKDPLNEYTEEAFYMFEQMTNSIAETISQNIVHLGIRPGSEEENKIPHLNMELTFKDDDSKKKHKVKESKKEEVKAED